MVFVKRILYAALLVIASVVGSLILVSSGADAKQQKVGICHAAGDAAGHTVIIHVAESAVDAHLGHGDALFLGIGTDSSGNPAVVCEIPGVLGKNPVLLGFEFETKGKRIVIIGDTAGVTLPGGEK